MVFQGFFGFGVLKGVRFAARNSTFKIHSQRYIVVINKMCATKRGQCGGNVSLCKCLSPMG